MLRHFEGRSKLCPNCAQKYRGMHKNPLKYRKIPESGKPGFSAFYRGKRLFSGLFLFPVQPTHGRSHRFKSCIAHHFLFNNLRDSPSRQNGRSAQNYAQIRGGQQRNHVMQVLVAQVGIDFRSLDRLVAQQLLDCTNVPRSHHQIARKGMPPGMHFIPA